METVCDVEIIPDPVVLDFCDFYIDEHYLDSICPLFGGLKVAEFMEISEEFKDKGIFDEKPTEQCVEKTEETEEEVVEADLYVLKDENVHSHYCKEYSEEDRDFDKKNTEEINSSKNSIGSKGKDLLSDSDRESVDGYNADVKESEEDEGISVNEVNSSGTFEGFSGWEEFHEDCSLSKILIFANDLTEYTKYDYPLEENYVYKPFLVRTSQYFKEKTGKNVVDAKVLLGDHIEMIRHLIAEDVNLELIYTWLLRNPRKWLSKYVQSDNLERISIATDYKIADLESEVPVLSSFVVDLDFNSEENILLALSFINSLHSVAEITHVFLTSNFDEQMERLHKVNNNLLKLYTNATGTRVSFPEDEDLIKCETKNINSEIDIDSTFFDANLDDVVKMTQNMSVNLPLASSDNELKSSKIAVPVKKEVSKLSSDAGSSKEDPVTKINLGKKGRLELENFVTNKRLSLSRFGTTQVSDKSIKTSKISHGRPIAQSVEKLSKPRFVRSANKAGIVKTDKETEIKIESAANENVRPKLSKYNPDKISVVRSKSNLEKIRATKPLSSNSEKIEKKSPGKTTRRLSGLPTPQKLGATSSIESKDHGKNKPTVGVKPVRKIPPKFDVKSRQVNTKKVEQRNVKDSNPKWH